MSYNKLSVKKISYIRTIILPGFINSVKFTVTIFHFKVMYNNAVSKYVNIIMLPIYKSNRLQQLNFLGTIRIQSNYIFVSVCCNIANYIDYGRFYLRAMMRVSMSGVFQKFAQRWPTLFLDIFAILFLVWKFNTYNTIIRLC